MIERVIIRRAAKQDIRAQVHPLHNAIYGLREFKIRDLNRFWMTFGQPL